MVIEIRSRHGDMGRVVDSEFMKEVSNTHIIDDDQTLMGKLCNLSVKGNSNLYVKRCQCLKCGSDCLTNRAVAMRINTLNINLEDSETKLFSRKDLIQQKGVWLCNKCVKTQLVIRSSLMCSECKKELRMDVKNATCLTCIKQCLIYWGTYYYFFVNDPMNELSNLTPEKRERFSKAIMLAFGIKPKKRKGNPNV